MRAVIRHKIFLHPSSLLCHCQTLQANLTRWNRHIRSSAISARVLPGFIDIPRVLAAVTASSSSLSCSQRELHQYVHFQLESAPGDAWIYSTWEHHFIQVQWRNIHPVRELMWRFLDCDRCRKCWSAAGMQGGVQQWQCLQWQRYRSAQPVRSWRSAEINQFFIFQCHFGGFLAAPVQRV